MPRSVDLDDQRHAAVHGDSQRLRAAHAAQAGGQHQPAVQAPPKLLLGAAASVS